jgi:hypothetical protein
VVVYQSWLGLANLDVVVCRSRPWFADLGLGLPISAWVCCLQLGGVVVVVGFWMLGLQLGGERKKKLK